MTRIRATSSAFTRRDGSATGESRPSGRAPGVA